jgi:phage shock protein A
MIAAMGVFDRMSRVIAGNFNSLLDRFDEPGRDIAQVLLDMKEQISLGERELIRAIGEKKRVEARLEELSAEAKRWESRAELAVRQGQDPLAREALTQKRRVAAELSQLTRVRDEQHGAAISMKAELERMRQKHQEYSSRKNTLAVQVGQARAGGGVEALGARPGGESPFEAMRRMEQNMDAAEAAAGAAQEVDTLLGGTGVTGMSRAEVEARFAELEKGGAGTSADGTGASEGAGAGLDGELAALKKRVRIEL